MPVEVYSSLWGPWAIEPFAETFAPKSAPPAGSREAAEKKHRGVLERESSRHLDIARATTTEKRILRSHVRRDRQRKEADALAGGRIDSVVVP